MYQIWPLKYFNVSSPKTDCFKKKNIKIVWYRLITLHYIKFVLGTFKWLLVWMLCYILHF